MEITMESVIASASIDSGISSWELRTGIEKHRYRSCASPPHGLVSVAGNFLASSQFKGSSGSVFYWSWNKPQVEVRSFLAEAVGPLTANSEGTYLFGGGASGNIYMWEVASGRMLKKWEAHYRAVTCLVLSKDESFLVSGSDDGGVIIWPLLMLFDEMATSEMKHRYQHSFFEHSLRVTDVVTGCGLCDTIAISSSEDHTCKIWSLSRGKLLRSVTFPSVINAVAIDPWEHVFYAAGRDGKIYISSLNAECNTNSDYGMHIIRSFSEHSASINCLTFSRDGVTLVSGHEDGTIRAWETKAYNMVRVFKLAKGPVNNVLIETHLSLPKKRVHMLMPPSLEKNINRMDEKFEYMAVSLHQSSAEDKLENKYCSYDYLMNQFAEHQHQDSSGSTEMEFETLKLECKRLRQMCQDWKHLYQNLHNECVDKILDN